MVTKQDIQDSEQETPMINTFQYLHADGTPKFELFSDSLNSEENDTIINENEPFHTEFSELYSKSLTILKKSIDSKEKSSRILELTEYLLLQNPSDILVWWYRKRILESFNNVSIEQEFKFTDIIQQNALKSYQAWEHRKWIFVYFHYEPTVPYLETIGTLIDKDIRNFHAWSHLIWLSSQYISIRPHIFDLTTVYINREKRNASAWNARFTIFKLLFTDISAYQNDIEFAFGFIGDNGGNEASCSYIRGIAYEHEILVPFCIEKVNEFIKKGVIDKSVYALYLHLTQLSGDTGEIPNICTQLAKSDSLRRNYWNGIKNNDKRFI